MLRPSFKGKFTADFATYGVHKCTTKKGNYAFPTLPKIFDKNSRSLPFLCITHKCKVCICLCTSRTLMSKNAIYSILNCYICKDTLENPTMCAHCHQITCSVCIHRWMNECYECPHCRIPITASSLVKVPLLSDIVEIVQRQQENAQKDANCVQCKQCNVDEKAANYYCQNCCVYMCADCLIFERQHASHCILKAEQIFQTNSNALRNRLQKIETIEEKLKRSCDADLLRVQQVYEKELKYYDMFKKIHESRIDKLKEFIDRKIYQTNVFYEEIDVEKKAIMAVVEDRKVLQARLMNVHFMFSSKKLDEIEANVLLLTKETEKMLNGDQEEKYEINFEDAFINHKFESHCDAGVLKCTEKWNFNFYFVRKCIDLFFMLKKASNLNENINDCRDFLITCQMWHTQSHKSSAWQLVEEKQFYQNFKPGESFGIRGMINSQQLALCDDQHEGRTKFTLKILQAA